MEKDVQCRAPVMMVATSSGGRSDVDAPAPLDAARISQEAFGFLEPAGKIEKFARFMAVAAKARP